MSKLSVLKKALICAVCIALCAVLPMAFHAIPNAGSIFSPMHIPALLCGLVCGPWFGLLCGLAGPFVSSMVTGMPPMAYLPPMMVELAVYGLVAGLMMQFVRTKKSLVDVVISMIVAMLVGRIVAGAAKALIFAAGEFTMAMWISSYFVAMIPGIIMHLVAVPALYYALQVTGLIPRRYIKQ